MGHPTKCKAFTSKWDTTLLLYAFKLNSALAKAEKWHLEGCMRKFKAGWLDVRTL